ncbi:hypothetical protein [Cycloclasticus pugetii]|uniref:hypothetical protein n=1 Tax=Cycloclasticus pugetii TaxID=34068 RepID=UPI00240A1C73|nr:hypothetical protein [Cycloclasticus pugetii]MDF1830646.1 hypothetical protein [Cycloclasticus pugetii]
MSDVKKSYDLERQINQRDQRIEELENMLIKKLDLIRCGIGSNYSGDHYENDLYKEAAELVGL